MATHFTQYGFCDVCKRNHIDGKKHVYTKYHRDALKKLLTKFRGKFSEMKKVLKLPEIHHDSWEMSSKVWCYFCDCDVQKHIVEDQVTVSFFGMMKHVSSEEHHKAAKKFWWQNKLKKEQLADYLLESEMFKRFLDKLPVAKQKYELKMDCLHEHSIHRIRSTEAKRLAVVKMAEAEVCARTSSILQSIAEKTSPGSSYQNIQTAAIEKRPGNVFTGAVPPWLWDDSTNTKSTRMSGFGHTSASVIGPTIVEYTDHLVKEKKKLLNPYRVGANFDHSAKTSASWLPSFGRVWNNGRRLQSRYQYRKEVLRQRNSKLQKQKKAFS